MDEYTFLRLFTDKYCFYCERSYSHKNFRTRDHIIPLSKGGSNAPINIINCCNYCNQLKRDFTPAELALALDRHLRSGTPYPFSRYQPKKKFTIIIIDNLRLIKDIREGQLKEQPKLL